MSRPLSATIHSVTGTPREGALLAFVGTPTVTGLTDAGGVLTVALEVGAAYTVSFAGACIVDGVDVAAGTVYRLTVPEGEGPVTLAECVTATEDASPAALLALLADLTARVAALEGP